MKWEVRGTLPSGKLVKSIVDAPDEATARTLAETKLAGVNVRSLPASKPLPQPLPQPVIRPPEPAPLESLPQPVLSNPALIACPACGLPISRAAAACLRCGHPMAQPVQQAVPLVYAPPEATDPALRVQVTEATGKQWKAVIAVGAIIAIVGGVIAAVGFSSHPEQLTLASAGGVVFFVGVVMFIYGRLGAWWDHG